MVKRTKESLQYVILRDGCRKRITELCPVFNFRNKRIIQELVKERLLPEIYDTKIQQKIYNIIKYQRSLHIKGKTDNSKEKQLPVVQRKEKKDLLQNNFIEKTENLTISKVNEKQFVLKSDYLSSEIQKYVKQQIDHLILTSFVKKSKNCNRI